MFIEVLRFFYFIILLINFISSELIFKKRSLKRPIIPTHIMKRVAFKISDVKFIETIDCPPSKATVHYK